MLKNTFSEEAMQSIGWRLPLLIGLINILISFWFRAKLPDYKSELDENQYSVGSMYFGFSIYHSWYCHFLLSKFINFINY